MQAGKVNIILHMHEALGVTFAGRQTSRQTYTGGRHEGLSLRQTDSQTTRAACQGSPWPLFPCLVWSSSAVGQSVWRAQLTSLPPERPHRMLTLKLSCSLSNDLQGERVRTEQQLQMESCEKPQKQRWMNQIFIFFMFKSPERLLKKFYSRHMLHLLTSCLFYLSLNVQRK